MKTINVEGGGFPGTSKTWRFIAEMIAQNAELTTNIVGGNAVVSGLGALGPNAVTSGLIVLGNEFIPVQGGPVDFADAYISITEDIEQTQYLKDEDGDGSGDLIDTYFEKYGVITDQSEGNVKLSDLDRLNSLREMSKRIPPMKSVIMFYGTEDDLTQGYQFCDGTNGTPDLRGKFIVGQDPNDNDYNNIGKTGGSKRHTLTENEMPQHSHNGSTNSAGSHSHSGTAAGPYDGTPIGGGFDGGGNAFRNRSISINNAGNHSHTVSIGSKGGSQPHENRPPYYALAYIAYTGV
jgi:microcystin-dependent protein